MPNCGCQKYTPQDPPVNSREDTGLRGEEVWTPSPCDPANLVPSPLADTAGGDRWEKEKNLGNPKPCRDCGENIDNGEMYWRRRDIYICDSCSTPPSKQSEEVFGMKVEIDETMQDGTWKLKEGKPTPPKAEGVGDVRNGFLACYQKRRHEFRGSDLNGQTVEFIESFIDTCISLATREAVNASVKAAEERKDEEIMSAIRFIEFSLFKWDEKSMPLNREVVGNVLTLLQNKLHALLPPPPSN